ncbi:MAG: B12-binding domain-containing radical SAM protein [Candidatus Eremiobacteraeota bacterium]|nr:B12-binding domain-containing radical SAM protein [Candidatus Eremiobacteraeota bacterium]
MKILLIEPPHKYWKIFKFHSASPALGALSGYLVEKGINVEVLDLNLLPDPWAVLEETIKKSRPDIAGITCTVVPHIYDALQVAALIKMLDKNIITVGGGHMFNALAEESLRAGNLDFIVIGEGEITFLELINTLAGKNTGFSKIKGLAYLSEGKFIKTEPRSLIPDLNDLPYPAWHLFPMDRYHIQPLGGKIGFGVSNSRGCYNKCSYCSETAQWGAVMRSFSGERTAEHLEILVKKYKKKVFIFGDNDFLWDRQRLIDFCREIEKRNIKAMYWIQATTKNTIANQDLFPALKKAGCFNFQLGIESITPEVLENYRKPQDLSQIEKAIKAIKANGISVTGLFMWGDWYDDRDSLRRGLKFILKNCDFWAPNIVNPFPGTDYYLMCEAEGRIKERDLRRYNQYHIIMPTSTMTMEEAQEFYDKTAFSFPVALKMIQQAIFSPFWPNRVWAREFIILDIKYNLFPWTRKIANKSFQQYLRETGRPEPPWQLVTPPWDEPVPERPRKKKGLEFKIV